MRITMTLEEGVWVDEGDWQHSEKRWIEDDLLCIAWFERFDGIDATRVTWLRGNAYAHHGAELFDDLVVKYDGEVLYSTGGMFGKNAIQVRGGLMRRAYVGPDAKRLANYEQIEPVDGYPGWVEGLCREGLAQAQTAHKLEHVGIYNVGDPGVIGASSMDGSHGGWEVAPWHMGVEGWQRGSRAGYVWAEVEMFSTFDRSPLLCFEGLEPKNYKVPYWPGRSNIIIPGYEKDPDPRCPYLPRLDQFEAPAGSHFRRATGGPAMLMEKDMAARWLMTEVYWHDFTMWLDGGEGGNALTWPIEQLKREIPQGRGWRVGRTFAHCVRTFLEVEPYLPAEDARFWRVELRQLIRHIARPNGTLHNMGTDNTYGVTIQNACRAREDALMYPNLAKLGLHGIARRVKRTVKARGGMSVSASFDGTNPRWFRGQHSAPNYYPWYDLMYGDLTTLDLEHPLYSSPFEQQLSCVDPKWIL